MSHRTWVDDVEADPVGSAISAMPRWEFLAMLDQALTKDLGPADLSVAHGFPCFWGSPALEEL